MNCYPNYREIEKLVQIFGLEKSRAKNPDLYFKNGDIASQALQGLKAEQIILKFVSLLAGLNSLESEGKKLYGKGGRSAVMGEWVALSETIQRETKIRELWRDKKGYGNCKENDPQISFLIDDSMFLIRKYRIDHLKKNVEVVPLDISSLKSNLGCNDHLIYEDGDYNFIKAEFIEESKIKEFLGAIRLIYNAAIEDNANCFEIKSKGDGSFIAKEFVLKNYFDWK